MALVLISPNTSVITGCVKSGETVTAGNFVKADASSNDVVTSAGLSSYAATDIEISEADAATDYPYVIGIAGTDGSAGDCIPVYTEGIFIVRAGEAITAGAKLQKAESTDAAEVEALDSTYAEHEIGRALTGASAADKYIIMLLRV